MSGIIWAALIGAAGGVIGYALSLLFPKKVRPVIAAACVALAIAATSPIRNYYEKTTMTPERFERTVTEQLKTSNARMLELMQLYKEHEPELYQAMMKEASDAFRKGGDKDAIANVVRAKISAYMTGRLKELSDDGVLRYTDLLARQFAQMGKEGQDGLCVRMLKGEPLGAMNPSSEMIELEFQLVQSAVRDPGGSGEKVEQAVVEAAVNAAVAELMTLHGQENVQQAFGALSDASVTPAAACAIYADYFRLLKKAAEPQAAPVLRTIYASEA